MTDTKGFDVRGFRFDHTPRPQQVNYKHRDTN